MGRQVVGDKGLGGKYLLPLALAGVDIQGNVWVQRAGDQDPHLPCCRQHVDKLLGSVVGIHLVPDRKKAPVRRLVGQHLVGQVSEHHSTLEWRRQMPHGAGYLYQTAVDDVLDTEELVIKPAAPAVMAAGVYAGQTLPDSGLPMLLLDCAGIASAAGLQFTREAIADDVVVEETVSAGSALLFDDLDGARRLVPLAIIERIELVSTDAIRFSAGRLRLSTDTGIVPLVAMGAWQDHATVAVLRLRDGESEIGYAISEALDIFALPSELVPAAEPGPVAGVVSLDGEQVELLDLHWLFANHGGEQLCAAPPVCLIDGADQAWMMTFLKPVLEGAGYRVAAKLKKNESAAVVLTMDADRSPIAAEAPVIRLRREANAAANDLSIYRYDRPGLLAALAQSAGGR